MPAVRDFRLSRFDVQRIDASGKSLGKQAYWQLYAIENLIRVIVHSVLTSQIGPHYWSVAVDPNIQRSINRRKQEYARQPWHSIPGRHDIYYAMLSEVNKIMSSNINQFQPLIPKAHVWVARIEEVRLPRNVVGHMNWLTKTDRDRISIFHADVQQLANHLSQSGVSLTIP